jgi:D-glycero-alpha-D-manno-heptose-7-phosphate kinase
VWNRFLNGENTEAFRELGSITVLMRDALESDDLNSFSEFLALNWSYQKQLHPEVTTNKTEELFKVAMNNGAISGKACGAGGGGCLLFYCNDSTVEQVKTALNASGGRVLPFKFTDTGLTWMESENGNITIPHGRTFP